ncbi:protein YbgS [Cedecea davisae]|uniref:protein YbgS n=1 Tax=Cedecea davisae TaxID=158484 RepID=UPI002430390A|nr:protein YbgS [Cedecea davisae]
MLMKKLTTLLLTATLALGSGAAFAADSTSGANNGQANASAEAGQVAPDAQQNVAPNGVKNSHINNSHHEMSKSEVHKNSMCKDGRCPDTNKKVETGSGNGVNTKVDGTSQ